MAWKRLRGTAIVESEKGILVTGGRRKIFILPGGSTKKGETQERAAIRELYEETELHATACKYLFSYVGVPQKAYGGGHFIDHHKVFIIRTEGNAKPRHEVKYIKWFNQKSSIELSTSTRDIINKYLEMKKEQDFSEWVSTKTSILRRISLLVSDVRERLREAKKNRKKFIKTQELSRWHNVDNFPSWVWKSLPRVIDPDKVYTIKGKHGEYKFSDFDLTAVTGVDRPPHLMMRRLRHRK